MTVEMGAGMHNGLENTTVGTQTTGTTTSMTTITTKGRRRRSGKETTAVPCPCRPLCRCCLPHLRYSPRQLVAPTSASVSGACPSTRSCACSGYAGKRRGFQACRRGAKAARTRRENAVQAWRTIKEHKRYCPPPSLASSVAATPPMATPPSLLPQGLAWKASLAKVALCTAGETHPSQRGFVCK